MGQSWISVENISINSLLLLERFQIKILIDWLPKSELGLILSAHSHIKWFFEHKCPEIRTQIREMVQNYDSFSNRDVKKAEQAILEKINDFIVYALDPARYDQLPFMAWDDNALLSIADFKNKTILDIGAGTGRLTFIIAEQAKTVYAVEPVENLREYIREKAACKKLSNIFPVDGLITAIPFEDNFADITMGAHVFGDEPDKEFKELYRVTKPGGMIILCPGNNDRDNDIHRFLTEKGMNWDRFEEPQDGMKRKYWLTK